MHEGQPYPTTDEERQASHEAAEAFLSLFAEIATDNTNAAVAGLLNAAYFIRDEFTIKPN